MTFNDFIKQGVTVQGATIVSSFDVNGTETIHYEGYPDDDLNGICVDEEWADRKITYIFALDNTLHIEVDNE